MASSPSQGGEIGEFYRMITSGMIRCCKVRDPIQMHDIVIGLFVNRYEFGLQIEGMKCKFKTSPELQYFVATGV
jgi:hypothetical protein